MDKKLKVNLLDRRVIEGVLKGYDLYSNLTLVEARQVLSDGSAVDVGSCVCPPLATLTQMVRGNSVVSVEPLEALI